MKRFLAGFILVFIMLALCGCGKNPAEAFPELISNFENEFETTPYPIPANESIKHLIEHYSGGALFPAGYNGGIQSQPPTSYPQPTASSSTTLPSGTQPQPTTPIKKDVCADLKEAEDMVLDYMRAITESFSITIDSKTDFSQNLLVFATDYFPDNYVVDGMFLKSVSISGYQSSSQTTYTLNVNYAKPADEVRRLIDLTYTELDSIDASLNLSALPDEKRVEKVNDYLCSLADYPASTPYSDESHTVYGCLIEKSCVCEGYAKTAKALLDRNGVEISYIRGTTSGGNHGWNLVKLNGEWYHLDVTWNDAGGDRKTFYLVTDEFMRQSRAWDTSKYPKSSAVSYGS